MREPSIDNALEVVADRLSLQLGSASGREYGWNRKSVGAVASAHNGQRVWLKVFGKSADSAETKLWDGELLASNLFPRVHKPTVLSRHDWNEGSWVWRCLVMNHVDERVLSEKPTLSADAVLPKGWASRVYSSLEEIAEETTDRVGVRQDLVTRRIAEQFGPNAPTLVQSWVVGHNDLHFANLTGETAWILDWESWGLVPAGFDAAWLYCNSLANRRASQAIYEMFEPLLACSTGWLSLLFSAAELKRMYRLHGEYPEIQNGLDEVASQAMRKLK